MKKLIIMMIVLCIASGAMAQSRSTANMSEAELLGLTAGTALACNAGAKLDDFELIANRYIANQALSDADEKKGYTEYARAKLNTFNEQKKSPPTTCGEVLSSFGSLKIFKTVVYADGSIKTPEGKMIKARKPVASAAAVASGSAGAGGDVAAQKTVQTAQATQAVKKKKVPLPENLKLPAPGTVAAKKK